jgi:energy-coupling factor transporter ATP-binding protein EcfA2
LDEALRRLVLGRLTSHPPEMPRAEELIMAASDGSDSLERALKGEATAERAPGLPPQTDSADRGVWIDAIAGFRGVGPRTALSFVPKPGLTLVVGRNGSGKSSFAEALEFLLTGTNYRWAERSRIWSQGWRNLHQPESAITARFARDGSSAATVVEAAWAPEGDLVDARRRVSGPKPATIEELGWNTALGNYRPFLSYNELGSLLDEGPTRLYDALVSILGLQDLTVIQQLLRDARLSREAQVKQVAQSVPALLERLNDIDDMRARACLKALSARRWDLDVVELALRGAVDEGDVETELSLLRQLATLEPPNPVAVTDVALKLTIAAEAVARTSKTDSGQARRTMRLLKDAVAYHKHSGDGSCPVCHRPDALTDEWRKATLAEIEVLAIAAAEAEAAEGLAKIAVVSARALLMPVPESLKRAGTVNLDASELTQAWATFVAVPSDEDLAAVADHIATRSTALASALDRFRTQAQAELDRREDAWRPIAYELGAWLAEARPAMEEQGQVPALKAAEKWVKEATGNLRDERFAPIADRVDANWRMLRQDSNVTLAKLRLEGSGTQRHVALDIDVDGQPGAALAVMSQGELNCLALSLFLPRATLAESPFRFVVIDDPVQSMDPAKVDGLARVLQEAAKTRQVIVLTHDDRLPQAIWRLDIAATILEVNRREHSVVEIRAIKDVVQRHLEDAWAVAADANVPLKANSVVPGFCRFALEEACAQRVWTHRLAKGQRHEEIEREIQRVTTVTMWMAIALFDDPERGGDVMGALNNHLGRPAGDAFLRLKRGVHEADTGDLKDLIRKTEQITHFVLAGR